MPNLRLLTEVALLLLAFIAQPVALTGLQQGPAVQVFRSIDVSSAQGGDPLAKNEVMAELTQK